MSARIGVHEVRNPVDPQPVAPFPVEHYVDVRTGQRLRRQFLGSCSGGILLIGGIARSTGVDLYFRRTQGNASPGPVRSTSTSNVSSRRAGTNSYGKAASGSVSAAAP